MMTGKNDYIRFFLPVLFMALGAMGIGVRLVLLHLDLISKRPPVPKYVFTRFSQGTRGTIFSAGNSPLAQTKTVWTYHLDPQQGGIDPDHPGKPISPEKRMEKMKTIAETLQMPLTTVMDAYAKSGRYVYLATSDDDSVHDVLTDPKRRLGELSIAEKQVRVHPQGRRLSQVLGFVSKDPTNAVGGAGLELKYERFLKGLVGEVRGTRNAQGGEVRIRRNRDVDAKPGCDVYLTIDHNIQYQTEKILAEGLVRHQAERVWAVVLQVKTGAVLAMATMPDYDPGMFNRFPDDVKINRVISENYEPGSVMKTITACAALNEGIVSPDTQIATARNDPNYSRLPGDSHKMDDILTVRDALVHSCNVVYGKLGVDLGPKRLWTYMTSFGFGRRSGIELPGEETGIIPNYAKWDKVKWSRAPIGQGVSVTAMQLAAAYAAIGNDGELLRPYIVSKVLQYDEDAPDKRAVVFEHKKEVIGHPIKPEVAAQVREMMLGVAKKGGTATRAAVPGYSVAGKTGTAQMKEGRGYSDSNFNASFIGIVPASRPEIVILVTYQKPACCRRRDTSEAKGIPLFNHQGGVCAAPTFSELATSILRYLEIAPDIPEEVPEEEDEVL